MSIPRALWWYTWYMPSNRRKPTFPTPPWHNDNRPQFKLTATQVQSLMAMAPPDMNLNLAAKWLVLQTIDPPAAAHMADRASKGYKRLADHRQPHEAE